MHREVKKSADAGDVKDLKYIFVDSLDVDPTFEEYLDDYNYCVDKNLFERHKDLTPFTDHKTDWNDDYWDKIKRDLLKNFSRERLDHMRKVALVINAEKVVRLQRERQSAAQTVEPEISHSYSTERPVTPPQPHIQFSTKSKAQQQQEELEAAKQKLAEENAQVERQQQQRKRQQQFKQQREDNSSKKSSGIASKIVPLIAGLGVVGVIVFVLKKLLELLLEP